MKRNLQTKGIFSKDGSYLITHFFITKEAAKHELNAKNKLKGNSWLEKSGGCSVVCPDDTADGYYVCSGTTCVFIPYT